jgi:hypothetical protein
MTTKPKSAPRKPADVMAASDLRTQMVKEQTARENAEFEARTQKLRALRLAKEEADRAVAAPAPQKPKRKRIT